MALNPPSELMGPCHYTQRRGLRHGQITCLYLHNLGSSTLQETSDSSPFICLKNKLGGSAEAQVSWLSPATALSCKCLHSEALNNAFAYLPDDPLMQAKGKKINLLSFRCRHRSDQRQQHLRNDEEHYNFNLVIGLRTIYAGDEKKKENIYEM